MPRNTKASRILNDAAMRLEAARIRERMAQSDLNTAKETLRVLQEAYDALERELAPKPRKKAAQSQPAQAALPTNTSSKAPKADSNGALCVAQVPGLDVLCGNLEDNGIHDPNGGYGGYHPFVPPAQTATRRSSRRNGATKASESSTPNSETPPASVGNVAQESQMSASAGGD